LIDQAFQLGSLVLGFAKDQPTQPWILAAFDLYRVSLGWDRKNIAKEASNQKTIHLLIHNESNRLLHQ
jgi:hypothetical protein